MTPPRPARLMLLEDHAVVRDGIRALLDAEPDFDVVHATGSADDALAMLPVVLPHLVLVDLNLPDVDGIAFLRHAARDHAHVRCVVLTSVGDAARTREAVSAGARAVLGKSVSRDALVDVVRRVMKGEFVPPRVGPAHDDDVAHLTAAELRVLRMIADGLGNEAIGGRLGTTVNTVKSQAAKVFRKLGVENRTSAIRRGRELGLIA